MAPPPAHERPPRRHLPVLRDADAREDEGPERPPWQWVGVGLLLLFVVWWPLAWAVLRANQAWSGLGEGQAPTPDGSLELLVASELAAFALACAASGYVVGRFGGRTTPRQTAIVGALAPAFAWLLAVPAAPIALRPGMTVALVGLALLGAAVAFVAARRGRRGR